MYYNNVFISKDKFHTYGKFWIYSVGKGINNILKRLFSHHCLFGFNVKYTLLLGIRVCGGGISSL